MRRDPRLDGGCGQPSEQREQGQRRRRRGGPVAGHQPPETVDRGVGTGFDRPALQGAPEIRGQFVGGRVAAFGILVQTPGHDQGQITGDRRDRAVPSGGHRSGDELVDQDSERVDVAGRRHRGRLLLFGRSITARERGSPRHRQLGIHLDGVVQQLGHPEVEQLHGPVVGHEDVRGLEIAVNHETTVRRVDRIAHRTHQVQARGRRELLVAAVVGDRPPLDVLHHQEGPSVGGDAAVEQTCDVRMLQRGQDPTLLAEALEEDRVVSGPPQELHGAGLFESCIRALDAVDHSHAPRAEPFSQSPAPDPPGLGGRFLRLVGDEVGGQAGGVGLEGPRGRLRRLEQTFDLVREFRVACAQSGQRCAALVRGGVAQSVEVGLDLGPAGRIEAIHGRDSSSSSRSCRSARALTQ